MFNFQKCIRFNEIPINVINEIVKGYIYIYLLIIKKKNRSITFKESRLNQKFDERLFVVNIAPEISIMPQRK